MGGLLDEFEQEQHAEMEHDEDRNAKEDSQVFAALEQFLHHGLDSFQGMGRCGVGGAILHVGSVTALMLINREARGFRQG